MVPRYSEEELWTRLLAVLAHREQINSLTGREFHRVVRIRHSERAYEIEYESGNRPKPISLEYLAALYRELYEVGKLTNNHMGKHYKRILGWSSWHAPGSAMMAILPLIDDDIGVERGQLHLKSFSPN